MSNFIERKRKQAKTLPQLFYLFSRVNRIQTGTENVFNVIASHQRVTLTYKNISESLSPGIYLLYKKLISHKKKRI